MPDNTWYTPYVLPDGDCLSIAASQGVAYRLPNDLVLKMPFQYPIGDIDPTDLDEAVEQLKSSQSSIDSFESERAFYRSLSEAGGHVYIVNVDHTTLDHGILLEYLQPLEDVWSISSTVTRVRWIRQLMRAVARIEELGFTHGDLAIRNMGVDKNNDLKVFDFGSVHRHSEQGIQMAIERDLSRLGNCLHFLASGKDPLADIFELQALRRVESALKNGTFEIDHLARPLEDILRYCWRQDVGEVGSVNPCKAFRHLELAVSDALAKATPSLNSEPASSLAISRGFDESGTRFIFNASEYDLVPDSRWLAEEQYRDAWKSRGVVL